MRDLLTFGVIFGLIAAVCLGVAWIISHVEYVDEETVKKIKKWLVVTIVVAASSEVAMVFVPTSRTVAAMIVLPAVVNNEKIQGITDNTLTILQNLTAKWANGMVDSSTKHNVQSKGQ